MGSPPVSHGNASANRSIAARSWNNAETSAADVVGERPTRASDSVTPAAAAGSKVSDPFDGTYPPCSATSTLRNRNLSTPSRGTGAPSRSSPATRSNAVGPCAGPGCPFSLRSPHGLTPSPFMWCRVARATSCHQSTLSSKPFNSWSLGSLAALSAFTRSALPPHRPECLYAGVIPVTSFAFARSSGASGLVQWESSAPFASDVGISVTGPSILVAGSIITSHSAPSASAHRATERIAAMNSVARPAPQISGGPTAPTPGCTALDVPAAAMRSSPHSPPSPEMDDVAPFTAVPAPRGGRSTDAAARVLERPPFFETVLVFRTPEPKAYSPASRSFPGSQTSATHT